MRALLRKLILWALDVKDTPSNATELDALARELKG